MKNEDFEKLIKSDCFVDLMSYEIHIFGMLTPEQNQIVFDKLESILGAENGQIKLNSGIKVKRLVINKD